MLAREKLEIFRMALYLTFPVGIFWIANQSEFFEKYAMTGKIFQPLTEEKRKELEDFKERIREMNEKKLLETTKK